MNTSKFHKIRDFEFLHRGKYDESLCEKIQRLAESVDFQHAKHNFFSAFLHVQDSVKSGLARVMKEKDPFLKTVKNSMANFLRRIKKSSPAKSHFLDTKERVLEVLHMDEVIDRAVQTVHQRRELQKKAAGVIRATSKIVSTNFVQPLKEVCTVSTFGKILHSIKIAYYRTKAGIHTASRPVFSIAKVFTVFAIIFAATFTILNIESLSTIAKDHIKTESFMSGYFAEREAAKKYVETQSLTPAPEDLVLAEEERQENKEKLSLIPLDIHVTPDDNRIVIPRIEENIPIVEVADEKVIYSQRLQDIEDSIQEALRDGVVRYPGTARPGEQGNVFITGHSSFYLTSPGEYKDVFALLHKVQLDDEIVIYYNQRRFKYKVTEIKTVKPNQVEILKQTNDYRLTLMTCTPIGTNLKRLVVTAIQIE